MFRRWKLIDDDHFLHQRLREDGLDDVGDSGSFVVNRHDHRKAGEVVFDKNSVTEEFIFYGVQSKESKDISPILGEPANEGQSKFPKKTRNCRDFMR